MSMMWIDLSLPWQECFKEAWTAFCHGSLPIGSVITNAQGQILARGRNQIHEQRVKGIPLSGHQLAHAEMNTLLQVEWNGIDPATCLLYTTTEPCPLCVGAIRISHVGEVHYASRGAIAGSVDLFEANAYMRSGNVKVVGPQDSHLEALLVALMIESALARASGDPRAHARSERLQASSMPTGVALGQRLFSSQRLRQWKNGGQPASFLFEQLVQELER